MPVYDVHRGDAGMVYCDGRLLPYCIRVDTDRGTALVYATGKQGLPRHNGYKPVIRPVVGRMEFVPVGGGGQ